MLLVEGLTGRMPVLRPGMVVVTVWKGGGLEKWRQAFPPTQTDRYVYKQLIVWKYGGVEVETDRASVFVTSTHPTSTFSYL